MPNRDNAWEAEHNVPTVDRQTWQLTHLVNAATNELSACLSLNSLLREARTQRRNDLVDIYQASMSHARASLGTYVNMVNELRQLMPKTLLGHTKDEVKRQAYLALLSAAYNTRKIMGYIEVVEGLSTTKMTTNDGHAVEGVGWPQCIELGALKGLCVDLVRNRHEGINAKGIGWKVAAKGWTEALDP